MPNVSDSALNLTKWMEASEVESMIDRVMVKIADLRRQKSLASRTSVHMDGQDELDMLEICRMLNYQINEASESVREFKLILASKQ